MSRGSIRRKHPTTLRSQQSTGEEPASASGEGKPEEEVLPLLSPVRPPSLCVSLSLVHVLWLVSRQLSGCFVQVAPFAETERDSSISPVLPRSCCLFHFWAFYITPSIFVLFCLSLSLSLCTYRSASCAHLRFFLNLWRGFPAAIVALNPSIFLISVISLSSFFLFFPICLFFFACCYDSGIDGMFFPSFRSPCSLALVPLSVFPCLPYSTGPAPPG